MSEPEDDPDTKMERIADVLRAVSPTLDAEEIDRLLLVAREKDLGTAGGETETEADVLAWLVEGSRGHSHAADRLLDILTGSGALPDGVLGAARRGQQALARAKAAGLGHAPGLLMAAGRGAAPLVFLLRDVFGYPEDRVRQVVGILDAGTCRVEIGAARRDPATQDG
ncbi:MAG: hypothetical protein ACK6CU_06030 [Deltaproteobacteria bacterium]